MQHSMTLARAFALTGLLVFTGCVSNPGGEIATSIDRAEGSTENIGSLTDAGPNSDRASIASRPLRSTNVLNAAWRSFSGSSAKTWARADGACASSTSR